MTAPLDEAQRLTLLPWVRLRFDEVRQRWVLLAPERVLFPCETSVEVLGLLDGRRTLGEVIDGLAAEYGAPRATIAADVTRMLGDLVGQRVLETARG